ncbi:MAG: hypothetical protein GF347_00715 [Candidatus Moranbacteria bacterium]|nr:hypothetical protein [Candidatus Moranbacteria bacterium]
MSNQDLNLRVVFHNKFKRKYKLFAKERPNLKHLIKKAILEIANNSDNLKLFKSKDSTIDKINDLTIQKIDNKFIIVYKKQENLLMLLDLSYYNKIDDLKLCDICENLLDIDENS